MHGVLSGFVVGAQVKFNGNKSFVQDNVLYNFPTGLPVQYTGRSEEDPFQGGGYRIFLGIFLESDRSTIE